MMVGRFIELCRRNMEVKADNSKVMLSGREEGSVYEALIDGTQLVFRVKVYLE